MTYGNLFADTNKTMTAVEPKGTTSLVYPTAQGVEPNRNMLFQNNLCQEIVLSGGGQLPLPAPIQNKLDKARQASGDFAVSEFGTEAGKKVAALADTVLKKTTTGKMGDFGDGLTQILTLTGSVNVDDLNIDKNKGVFGKVKGFFKKKQVEVMAQFEDTSKSIDKVVNDLRSRQDVMKSDNQFLDQLYRENMAEYHDLGYAVEAAEIHVRDLTQQY